VYRSELELDLSLNGASFRADPADRQRRARSNTIKPVALVHIGRLID
jgi:hypothetical protein